MYAFAARQPRRVAERWLRPLYFFEPGAEVGQHPAVESGADFAGIDQFATIVVSTKQKRPQSNTRAGRLGESAEHEFLTRVTFDLKPVARAPGFIRRVLAL